VKKSDDLFRITVKPVELSNYALYIFSLLILLLTSCLTVCIPVHTKGLYTKDTSLFDPGSNSVLKYWADHQIQSLSAVQEHLFETKSRCLRISEADWLAK